MQYATVQDLIDRFGERELVQLTDPDDQAEVKVAYAQRKLDDAHALVDGYVGRVYALPLLGCAKPVGQDIEYVPPPQLTRITCDVARYYLYTDVAPEHEVGLRFKNAMNELQAIASGDAVLACPWGGQPGQLSGASPVDGEVVSEFSPRRVRDDDLRGFR